MQVLLSFRPSDKEGFAKLSIAEDSTMDRNLKNLNTDLFDESVATNQEIVFI